MQSATRTAMPRGPVPVALHAGPPVLSGYLQIIFFLDSSSTNITLVFIS